MPSATVPTPSGNLSKTASADSRGDQSARGFGLYVHWPFCVSKCPYCDFNSHVRDTVDEDRWCAALVESVRDAASVETEAKILSSIFFGGGTPSLMAPETVASILNAAERHFGFAPDIEITLEANPNSVEAEKFQDYREAGINRLSLGVQALNDEALAFLGRAHSAKEALNAIETAQKIFARSSFDLIYARPGQTLNAWESELGKALNLANGRHLSLYQLTIERGTRFFEAVNRGDFQVADEDLGADLYDLTQNMCAAAGLPAYEISNHAGPDDASRHNLTYWRYGEYVGVGPGAHGRRREAGEVFATAEVRSPERWLAQIEQDGNGLAEKTRVSRAAQIEEILMMGLRLSDGIRAADFVELTNMTLENAFAAETIAHLTEQNLLALDDAGMRATPSGRLVLNSLIASVAEAMTPNEAP